MESWRKELYLAHHGILGMKWGRKNGPPYPLDADDHSAAEKKAGWRKSLGGGSSNSETKRRKGLTKETSADNIKRSSPQKRNTNISEAESKLKSAESAYKEAKKRYNRETLWGTIPASEETQNKLASAARERDWARQDLKDEKLKEKLNGKTGEKSAHQLKLESKYRNDGMTAEEAELAAYKRARTEKILAATAALTVVAAASYVAYKHYDYNTDKLISSGTILQNISNNSNRGVSDAFYASYLKGDKQKYAGTFAKFGLDPNAPVFNTSIKAIDSIKIPSQKKSIQILNDYNRSNPDFAQSVMDSIREHVVAPEKANKAIKSISDGVIDQNAWEAINEALTYHDSTAQEANNKVYDAFRKAGYDAILDVHDMDSETFGAKRPVIVFNGSIKTVVDSVSELSTSEMNFNTMVDVGKSTAESVIKECPPFLAATGIVIAGTKSVATSHDNKIVRDYRKAHPNTKLSYKEIIRNERRKQYT